MIPLSEISILWEFELPEHLVPQQLQLHRCCAGLCGEQFSPLIKEIDADEVLPASQLILIIGAYTVHYDCFEEVLWRM